jgi:hypothetical protein
MRKLQNHLPSRLALFCSYAVSATCSEAAVLAVGTEDGPDVVFQLTGTISTLGLTPLVVTPAQTYGLIAPQGGIGFASVLGSNTTHYLLGVPPLSPFGTGAVVFAESFSGSPFGLFSSSGFAEISVPIGYISGTPLSASMSFPNSSLQSLGLTPGSYSVTWVAGTQSDSFTLVIVPEPTISFFILTSWMLSGFVRRRSHVPV